MKSSNLDKEYKFRMSDEAWKAMELECERRNSESGAGITMAHLIREAIFNTYVRPGLRNGSMGQSGKANGKK